MTTEEIKCRLMEVLCEAANDQRQPVDTLNDMMESIKNIAQEAGKGDKQMNDEENQGRMIHTFEEIEDAWRHYCDGAQTEDKKNEFISRIYSMISKNRNERGVPLPKPWTNFEKWKSELTLEQILEIIKDEMTPHDMWVLWAHKYYLREENFLEWANDDAAEEDNEEPCERPWHLNECATQPAEETKDSAVEPVEPKGETCPKCGSDTVIITEVKIRRCSKCGYEFVPCPCGKTIRPANSALQYCEYCHTYFGTNDPEKDTVPWEKPQTNFDKWKESWTPESAGEAMSEGYPYWCGNCPCKKRCEELDDGYDGCIKAHTEWMKEKADEEWWKKAEEQGL